MAEPHHQSRIKTSRYTDKEEDRISELPDCLLIDIISRLPDTKQAIKTGTLSKRWQHLWPYVHNLFFIDSNYYLDKNFVSFVDKTLTQCCQSNLHKFQIHSYPSDQFKSQVSNWICYAVSRNVQDLDLYLTDIVLDEYIFINSCFTHLKLVGCVFDPTGAISWSKLTSLSISLADLSEDLIQDILSGCPLSETLELECCYGFKRIDIISKSVQNFMFKGYQDLEMADYYEDEYSTDDDIIVINAPYIGSLTIRDDLYLEELLLLLVDVSCLVKAHLDYKKRNYSELTREAHEEMLKGLILSLTHVKELKIGYSCLKALAGLKAKGFICPSNLKVFEEIDSN